MTSILVRYIVFVPKNRYTALHMGRSTPFGVGKISKTGHGKPDYTTSAPAKVFVFNTPWTGLIVSTTVLAIEAKSSATNFTIKS